MKGFFNTKTSQIPYKSEKGIHSCISCGLYKSATNAKIKPFGNFKKKIMVIGEGPGEEEDLKGKPWQGKIGRFLQNKYKNMGIDLFEDCISINAVNCRPVDKRGDNRPPTEFEISCCRQQVINTIKQYKPKVIILHGGAGVSSLIGYKWERDLGGISKWRGWAIPDRNYKSWVCPTFHPSYIERQEEINEVGVLWDNDLEVAFKKLEEPFPEFKDEENCIDTSNNISEILSLLNEKCPPLLAIDIEATGLKPYNKEIHNTVSISFCHEPDTAFAVSFPTKKSDLRQLKKLLRNPKIGKIAANMKYEDNWLSVMHGINVRPWVFDTMQATHILDNRPGICSLKFQAYVQFGVLGYDQEISSYLRSNNSNEPNRIMQLTKSKESLKKLLLYNGMDALLEYKLAIKQMKELESHAH